MNSNHDIVPTLRMFDGLIMGQAADEIERLRALQQTPNSALPPLGDGPRKKMLVEVEVPADWENRLDMQWVLEREIHADRWSWRWPETPGGEDGETMFATEYLRVGTDGPELVRLPLSEWPAWAESLRRMLTPNG